MPSAERAFGGPEGQVLGAVPAVLDAWTFVAVVYDQIVQTVKFRVDDMVFTKTGATLGSGLDQHVHRRQSCVQRVFRWGH